jgi:hypothetical protein
MYRTLFRTRSAAPPAEVLLGGLREARERNMRLRLQSFPRGIDNERVDVVLGPSLGKAVASLARAMVREQAQRIWNEPGPNFTQDIAAAFARVLLEHHRRAVKEAATLNRPERVQLFQLALLKLVLHQVDAEIAGLRRELEEARSSPNRQLSGQSMQFHQRGVLLARMAGHVRYRVAHQLVREMMRLENGSLKKLRLAALGVAWPVPERLLANPLLQLDGPGPAADFARIYPLLLHDPHVLREASHCVLSVLAAELPPGTMPQAGSSPEARRASATPHPGVALRAIAALEPFALGLFSEAELEDDSPSWLDVPDNATALFGGMERDWPQPGPWLRHGIERLQRRLSRRLEQRLKRIGLLPAVLAAYEFGTVYPSLGLQDVELALFDYLKGSGGRRELLRRLAAAGVDDPPAQLRRIADQRRAWRARPVAGRPQLLARFAGDCLRLRRDVRLAWQAFSAMDNIHLLSEQREIGLSHANDVLQLFCREHAAFEQRGRLEGHAVVVAELRAADELARTMRQRGLSATAHFSRWLYDPLGRLVERFGAQKIAVVGDRMLFTVAEYGTEGVERQAVTRACALAGQILDLGDAMNAEQARQGLPSIEMGIGLAYSDRAPIQVYDHTQQVTLTPAVAVARELAACDPLMRDRFRPAAGQSVCLAVRVATGEAPEGPAEPPMRYNVNGVELDTAAYARLHVEIPLHAFGMWDRRRERQVVFMFGCCIDLEGSSHALVLRERAARLWIGRRLVDGESEAHRYYELVRDPRLLGLARQRLGIAGETQP